MVFVTQRIIPLLIVLIIQVFNEFASGSRKKPILNVNESQRIINEGVTIELECTGDEGVVFHYPKNYHKASVPHLSTIPKKANDQKHHIKFFLNSTTFQDTGYYGCAYDGAEFKENIYNSSEASWIYIYVRSNQSSFVEAQNTKISGYIRHNIVIPCRPTSPNYTVNLFHEDPKNFVNKKVQCNDKIIFDPKFGFEIKDLNMKDEGRYQCEFIEGGTRPFQVNIFNLLVYDPPRIEIKHASEVATEGHNFGLECRIRGLSSYPGPQLRWIVANGDIYENSTSSNDRITSNLSVSKIRSDFIDLASFLNIENLASSDEGNYTCALLSNEYLFSSHIYLKVYVSNTQLIKLTSLTVGNGVDVSCGRNAEFAAKVDIDPDIDSAIRVEWSRPYRKTIKASNEKYEVREENFIYRLIIKNSQASDKGSYILRVSNGAQISATLEFILQVGSPLIIHFDTQQSQYEPQSKVEFHCHSTKPPAINMTWYFQKNLENGLNEEEELLKNAVVHENETMIASKISLTLNSTGNIICKVCNIIGCDRRKKSIIVPNDTLQLETSPGDITEGNDIQVTCTGAKLYYTKIMWYNHNYGELEENERMKFSPQNFSHHLGSIIRINSIMRSEKLAYACGATRKNGSIIFEDVNLSVRVKDSLPAVVIQSNMNGSEVTYDEKTAAQMIIDLTCYVEGSQKPNISWSKNGQTIEKENEAYRFIDGKQLLKITHPDRTHAGLYRCSVDGSDKVFQKITITRGPFEWWIIAGIILGCTLVGLVGTMTYRKMKHRKKPKPLDPVLVGNYTFFNYELVESNPEQLQQLISRWEFPRGKLDFGKRLGLGQFGQVLQGAADGIIAPGTLSVVAVKMARRSGGPLASMALNSEFRILSHMGKHLNILNLLGVVRDPDRGLLVVVEYCPHGSFQEYLKNCRTSFFHPVDMETGSGNQFLRAKLAIQSNIQGRDKRREYAESYFSPNGNPDEAATSRDLIELNAATTVIIDPDCPPNLHRDYESEIILAEDLLLWAYQVALGMKYVSDKKVIHGDLAARNILLAENNVVKICDFGLSKKLYDTNYYRKNDETPLPVKWMAIESMQEGIFTTQSDVWSFGILLWEIFTLADHPYPGFIRPQEVYQQLSEGYRMPKTKYMSYDIYSIIRQCWADEPASRPTFSQLVETIGDMLPKKVAKHFITLNGPSLASNKHQGRNRSDGNRDQVSTSSENQASGRITLNVVAGCSKDLDSVVIHCDHEGVLLPPSKSQRSEHPYQCITSSPNHFEQPNSNVVSPTSSEGIAHSQNPNCKPADSFS